MATESCFHCGKLFEPRPQNPGQRYCNALDCQRARKRKWQQDKLKIDPDYQNNQREAQRNWRVKNADYWRAYRAQHPQYVERNRAQQRQKTRKSVREPIAKMDVSMPPFGAYWIRPIAGFAAGKPTVWLIELQAPCATCPCKTDACKERT